MFKKYTIRLFDGTKATDLTYTLNESPVSQIWAGIMTKVAARDIRPHSTPWRGILKDWDKKVSELNDLIVSLNSWLPEKIDGIWNDSNPNESLNRLHVHFPELEKKEKDFIKVNQLSRYNDLIHEMQSLNNVRKNGKESMQLIICPDSPDINHIDIPDKCFKEFTHSFSFGDLVLNYCHIGRHPFEVFISNDLCVPPDQIIPQRSIYSYHSLRFFDINFDKDYFNEFYSKSKIKWPYALTDPKLAFGYIKMGRLELVNGQPWTKDETYLLVRNSNIIINCAIG
jgi:hypothetical protein